MGCVSTTPAVSCHATLVLLACVLESVLQMLAAAALVVVWLPWHWELKPQCQCCQQSRRCLKGKLQVVCVSLVHFPVAVMKVAVLMARCQHRQSRTPLCRLYCCFCRCCCNNYHATILWTLATAAVQGCCHCCEFLGCVVAVAQLLPHPGELHAMAVLVAARSGGNSTMWQRLTVDQQLASCCSREQRQGPTGL